MTIFTNFSFVKVEYLVIASANRRAMKFNKALVPEIIVKSTRVQSRIS